jgi:hypothetical protein
VEQSKVHTDVMKAFPFFICLTCLEGGEQHLLDFCSIKHEYSFFIAGGGFLRIWMKFGVTFLSRTTFIFKNLIKMEFNASSAVAETSLQIVITLCIHH